MRSVLGKDRIFRSRAVRIHNKAGRLYHGLGFHVDVEIWTNKRSAKKNDRDEVRQQLFSKERQMKICLENSFVNGKVLITGRKWIMDQELVRVW